MLTINKKENKEDNDHHNGAKEPTLNLNYIVCFINRCKETVTLIKHKLF